MFFAFGNEQFVNENRLNSENIDSKDDIKIDTGFNLDYIFLFPENIPEKTITEKNDLKKKFESDPSELTLEEMFLLAKEYPVNSSEFEDIIKKIIRAYPEDPIAAYDESIISIRKKDYRKAASLLQNLPRTSEMLNAMGMLEFYMGNYVRAEYFFSKGGKMGSLSAAKNQELTQRIIKNQKEED